MLAVNEMRRRSLNMKFPTNPADTAEYGTASHTFAKIQLQ